MKDRIRKIMESQHMAQNTFAQLIGKSPATLSSIFNERTRPTLDIVEAIKSKIPAVSTDWLLFGRGPMYLDQSAEDSDISQDAASVSSEPLLDFDAPTSAPFSEPQSAGKNQGVSNTPNKSDKIIMKYVDKPKRSITEIRIFYDDQTWESFVPKK
ncbi:MAG: helix-turn-helix transcriptional regulator [Prevotella sp.]|nr:helix-turn-helix transcriptional regulator [Prevotella sp.]